MTQSIELKFIRYVRKCGNCESGDIPLLCEEHSYWFQVLAKHIRCKDALKEISKLNQSDVADFARQFLD